MIYGYILAASVLLELLLYIGIVWKYARTVMVALLTAVISSITTLLLFEQLNMLTLGIAVLSAVRIFNYLRIGQKRMHAAYLYKATRRTSLWLVLVTLILLAINSLGLTVFAPHIVAWAILGLFVAAAMLVFGTLAYNVRKTAYRQGNTFFADKDLPSLSVLIPARNETTDLELCLRSCLASDYPKLEIIVLDDCSHHQTSDIIKKFAHDGVRFVKGSEPDDRWLAKNAAYDKLASEASGEILLFSGVDVRFGEHALRALVTELLSRDKQMISILPRRFSSSLAHAFVQPLRYWWELTLPRTLLNRPAVLSTCWLIRKKKFKKLGGFAAVSRSIIPERFFARELIGTNDYSFIRANDILDVQTAKTFTAQRETALRVKYPQLGKRPEMALFVVMAELLLLVGPFVAIIVALMQGNGMALILSAFASVLLICTHIWVMHLTNSVNILAAVWNLPFAVLADAILTLWSMYKYEFGMVIWKERNACIPVMHVVPRLPKS